MRSRRVLAVLPLSGVFLLGLGVPASAATPEVRTVSVQRAVHPLVWKFAIRMRDVRPPTSTPTPIPIADSLQTLAGRIAALVNVERAAAGLAPLTVSACATGFAERWSTQMARSSDFLHQSLRPILVECRARGVGENIAYGARSAEQFMSMWMNSSGHRANILRPNYTHLGVGLARSPSGALYATQDFLTL